MQVRDGDPAFAAGDRHTRKFMDLEPASHSLRSRQAMPLQLWRRSRPGVRGVDNRDMRPRRRGVSQRDGMFGAGRRSGHAPIRQRANPCAVTRGPRILSRAGSLTWLDANSLLRQCCARLRYT